MTPGFGRDTGDTETKTEKKTETETERDKDWDRDRNALHCCFIQGQSDSEKRTDPPKRAKSRGEG